MKSLRTKGKIQKTISIIIITLIIAILANWFQASSNQTVIDSTLREIENIGSQMEQSLESAINEGIDDLTLLAQKATEENINYQNATVYFDSQSQTVEFNTIYYIDEHGKGISAKNNEFDFSDAESYIEATKNNIYVTQPYFSNESGSIVVGIFVHIIDNDKNSGMLYGEIVTEELFAIFDDHVYGEGDIFIIDNDLNIIFSSSENHVGSAKIPESDLEQMGYDNIRRAQIDVIGSLNGSFYYIYFDTPKVMAYMPINETNWALAVNVEESVINSELVSTIKLLDAICISIYWFLIIVICYTAYLQSRSYKVLEKTAYYNSLTELPNILKLKLDIQEELAKNPDKKHSIVIFDIERFNVLNEMYGYETGDKILKTMKSLHDHLNEPDLTMAYLGGDKFALFAKNDILNDMEALFMRASVFFDQVLPELINHDITVKCGRYYIEPGETDVEEIMSKVSRAHKMARSEKTQWVCDYDDTFKKRVLKEAEISNKMKAALINNEFKVFLQPKFSVHGGELVGAEALVRWIEADGNMMFPNDFIPLFERNGFIVEVDKFILQETCKAIDSWMQKGMGGLSVSVNCSRLNLNNPYYVDGVIAIADKYNVSHDLIEIELTESVAIENKNSIEKLFDDLHSAGFKISIDDFGAGYSSLGMLKDLHVDTLKMDRSFFADGNNKRRGDMLIDSIVKMSHNLGIYVVAEGIEKSDQVEMLKTMNCDVVQGYVHEKPMPLHEFESKYCDIMKKNAAQNTANLPLIHSINDAKYASNLVPCGILIVESDENFKIIEANESFFSIVGYTKEEVRETFNNHSLSLIHPEDRDFVINQFTDYINNNPTGIFDLVCRVSHKSEKYKTVQVEGRLSVNENGINRVYLTVSDIDEHAKNKVELKNERDFNARIASLTNSIFFEYDLQTKTIRFSQNFAEKFDIPIVISDFSKSGIATEIFNHCLSNKDETGLLNWEGKLCLTLPNNQHIWYLFDCQAFFNENNEKTKIVGKMTESANSNVETYILKSKSDNSIYDKNATDRYIHNYLRTSTQQNTKGAFLALDLENFDKMEGMYGQEYANKFLQDIGEKLRQAFRSADLIGCDSHNNCFVFVNNYKTIDIIKNKATKLCDIFTDKDNENSLPITARIGIALYPTHGNTFETLYEKANLAIENLKRNGECGFLIYKEGDEYDTK